MRIFTHYLILIFCTCTFISFNAKAQPPVANFTANFVSGCEPLVVQFTSTSTNNPTSYAWNLGNSANVFTQQNPSTTYSAGTYTVTLTVTNASGSNTKTVVGYITVFPSPTVNFTGTPLNGCPGTTVQFTDQTTLNAPGTPSYIWNFGDGNTAFTQNTSHTFWSSGTYNITLQVTNGQGCTRTKVMPNFVQIWQKPVADFTASNTNPCFPPATVGFTSNIVGSGPYTYSWNFGDGSPVSTLANPIHPYTTSNTFTVTLYVTDSHGCKDTMTKVNYIGVGSLSPAFTGPTSACPGQLVSFLNTTNPVPSNVIWDFDDATGPLNALNAQHAWTNPGVYNVKMKAFYNGCEDSVIHQITIHPKPNLSFTFTPVDPCPAPATIQFNNTSTGASSYTWLFGDNSSSTLTSPSHTYNGDSFYTVKLVGVSGFGCADTLTVTQAVKVYDLMMHIVADTLFGCAPFTTNFSANALTRLPPAYQNWVPGYPYAITSYLWNFGDLTPTSSSPTPSHFYANVGTFNATLTVTTANGCTRTDTVVIHAGPHPTADFTAAPTTVCIRDSVQFTNLSIGALTYLWQFEDGGSTTTANPHHYFALPGIWSVTLRAYNNGCMDTIKKTAYITVLESKSVINFDYDCDTPLLVKFTNNSIGDSSHVWIFGDGFTSTQDNPYHVYPALGNYIAKLATYNSTTGCHDTAFVDIILIDAQPNFVSNDTAICKDDFAIFTGLNLANTGGYTWIIGNHYYYDTLSTITDTFHTIGYYTVKFITEDSHGCLDTVTKTNYQLVSKPTVNFGGAPTLGCTPMNVQFQDSSVYLPGTYPTIRLWTFGDMTSSNTNQAAPSHIYNVAGLYDVKIVVTDNVGCSDSMERVGYIEARHPEADFIADDSAACIGQVITFQNNSASPVPLTYEWDFGDNTPTSGAPTPTHAYTAVGVYTVRLIVVDATGCRDTMLRPGYIHITKPDASFTMSDTFAICPPLLVQFSNTSTGALGFTWTFGNGTSTVPSPSNIYNAPGQFTIMLIAQDGEGCTDTAYGHAEVLGYAGALTYTPLHGCAPMTVNFTALISNVPSLVWDFADGNTQVATSSTISHVYTTKGAYVPKLIISDGASCLTSSIGLDTIKVDGLDAAFTYVKPACIGSPVQFNDASVSLFTPMVAWTWTFSPTNMQGFQNPTYTYDATGTFTVTLVGTNAQGCKDTVTGTVDVLPLPIIDAGLDTVICKGDAATLLPSGGVSYTWGPAGTLSCTACTNPQASPGVPTVYTVTGKDAAGCANRDSVRVTLQIKTTSATNANAEVCSGSGVMLTGTGAHRYEWTPAATLNNSQVPNPVAMPYQNTTYMMVAWEGSCTPDTHYVHVVVHPKPKVNAGPDQTLVNGSSTKLQGSGAGIAKYFWLNDGTLSCDSCSNPTASPIATTTYTLSGYTDHGCADSDRVTVHVICDQSQVFIPNTFTPNGDGHNDYFYPRGKGIDQVKTMRIYNRWGQPVYEKTNFGVNDKMLGWDGTLKGTPLPPDVFVYIIEATCENGEPISFKGDVTLIR